jgi:ABC-type lipoprotein export system ATPase subunit
MALLGRLNSNGMTIIMVTHSQACADYARRILKISDGRLIADDLISGNMFQITEGKGNQDSLMAQNLTAAVVG